MSSTQSRRSFLGQVPLTLTAIAGLSAIARRDEAGVMCDVTPRQTKGPFYPVVNQLDKDVDLTNVAGRSGKAAGEVVWIQGVVRDTGCKPVADALVEIWQACASGRYNHPNDPNVEAALDPNFQYWGRAITDANGFYKFKTILPGSYPADVGWMRPPHVHFRVLKRGYHELITQMYFAGQALNQQDKILMSLSSDEQKSVVVQFAKSLAGEAQGTFDIQIKVA